MTYDIVLGRTLKDVKKFGTKAAAYIGKQYIQMGATTSLSNKVFLDMNTAHVVFISGKRGSGKCLTGDTLITLENGSQIPIKELAENQNKIFALNYDLQIQAAKKQGFFKRTVNQILHITLRTGKEIKLTPEHPLLTIKGWKKAEELQKGSRIATPRKINSFGAESLSEHEIKILAYMIAEGHTKKPLFFSNNDQKLINDLETSLKNFDPLLELTKHNNNYKINSRNEKRKILSYNAVRNNQGRFTKGSNIIIEKRKIRKFFEKHKIYDKLAIEKEIPEAIHKLPKHQLSLFLNRLFSCDGSIYYSNSWQISYSSSSKDLIKNVQHLLLRFGIISRLRNKNITCNNKQFISYELVMYSTFVEKFIQNIGFYGEKERKQNQSLEELKKIKNNPNTDTIPKEIWDTFRPHSWVLAGKALGYSSPKAARSSINYAPSRQKLLQIAEVDDNQRIKLLAESDIFWDEIISIERIQGKFEVFDFEVPHLHNFIANDIIVHNSYTMGVIAEGMANMDIDVRKRMSIILLDTMGVYWTMKFPNNKETELLEKWGLEPQPLDIKIYTPTGYYAKAKEQGIPVDVSFSIRPSELDPEDWFITFGISPLEPIGVFLERLILTLKEEKKEFSLDDIITKIKEDVNEEKHIITGLINRFIAAEKWGVFSSEGTPLKDLAASGQVTVLDLSAYATQPNGWKIKALVLGLIAKKLFIERMIARKGEEHKSIESGLHFFEQDKEESETPITWLVIDEAHEFLPLKGKTAASEALKSLLREGRQPGVSLILATQQPGKIHTDVMTQSDIFISHRLTSSIDVKALEEITPTYLRKGIGTEFNILPRMSGSALTLDDVNERIHPMQVRPRMTWHGGSAPQVLKEKKKVFEF